MADKNTIKSWFEKDDRPTQAQFWAWIDSIWHKDEKIPITAIDDIETILNEKADAEALTNHVGDAAAHADLFGAKEDKNKRGAALGYAPLNEFTKLAIDYLNVVNDLVTGGASSLLTAEQGKLLQTQINNINVLLASDNVNLDNVQELVDAIETIQMSLSSILVNDLTTGGTTKALTAEMGKTLKGLIDAKETISNKSTLILEGTNDGSNTLYPTIKAVVDWCTAKFQKLFIGIETTAGITYTLNIANIYKRTVFTGSNPVVLTVPVNSSIEIAIGTKKEFTVQGTGAVTIGGAGITFVQNNLVYVKGDTFHLTKIDIDTWTVEGNIGSSTLINGNVYVNSDPAIGNDATAQLGNPAKPYLTLSAAMTATNSLTAWRTFIFTSTSDIYYVNGTFGAGNYLFKSDLNVTISFQNNTLSDNLMPNSSTVDFNIPKGTMDFRSTGSKYLGSWYRINVICDTYRMNNSFALVGGAFNLTCNIAYHDGGYVQGGSDDYVSKITVNKIVNTGGGVFFQYGRNYVLDFNDCTSNGNFRLTQYSRSGIILHGNYTTTSTDEFAYVESYFGGSLTTILYKKNALITGNVTFSVQAGGSYYLSGTAKYTSNNGYGLFHNLNSEYQVTLENCIISCPKFHAFRSTSPGSLLLINSYVETGLFVWFTESGGATYTNPSVVFKGSNVVYMTGSTADYIATDNYMNTNTMNIKVIGSLKTNGVLQAGVTQNNLIP
ncbi:hypothetical protein [Flavobacterium algoritolerans]|uniref:Uncharacterized protein n=1 Tax=Flavobacterium algoritolerans TaxID=3041254 RepID=A0ABT6VAC9_9FLAO|nr:hypothetical protein [Flavobacterium algoritolerans]MDI5894408.1 hypothetical protein [Flavobacterium algoritolerans]